MLTTNQKDDRKPLPPNVPLILPHITSSYQLVNLRAMLFKISSKITLELSIHPFSYASPIHHREEGTVWDDSQQFGCHPAQTAKLLQE